MAKTKDTIKFDMSAELARYEPPAPSNRHYPIAYEEMALGVKKTANRLIEPMGYKLRSEFYEVRTDGTQMFGTLTWQNGHEDLGFSVGIRNSYDKSIAAGLCMGASVFVCSNMMFNGDITVMRKNTANGGSDFEKSVLLAMFDCNDVYQDMLARVEIYKQTEASDAKVELAFGKAFCSEILMPQQLTAAMRLWKKPEHEEFQERNLFNLYQAMNTPLKSCRAGTILEKHKALDAMFRDL